MFFLSQLLFGLQKEKVEVYLIHKPRRMKKNLILAAMLTLTAISCSKPHDDEPSTKKGYFRGKLDGVFFNDSISAHTSVVTSPMWGFNGITGSPIQGSGKINIVETANGIMKGTFECIAPADSAHSNPPILPPITITEGEFNLKY